MIHLNKIVNRLFVLILIFLSIQSIGQTPWSQLANFPGTPRGSGCIFIINDTVYAGAGRDSMVANTIYAKDFYKYNSGANSWIKVADIPSERWLSTSFSIGNKGYVALGTGNSGALNELVEYNPQTNVWTQKAPFPGPVRWAAFSFVLNNKAYVGGGVRSGDFNDLWEYDPLTDIWTQKASFINPQHAAVAFAINNKGYMGMGRGGNIYYNDFWEYDPAVNSWIQMANFPDTARYIGTGFSVNNKGYVGLGLIPGLPIGSMQNDFWEYDPVSNTWITIPNIPGVPRYHCIAASNNSTAFILGGMLPTLSSGIVFLNDFYSFPYKNFAGIETTHSNIDYSIYSSNKKVLINNKTKTPLAITLTDIIGKTIFSETFESGQHSIDLSTLPNCIIVYQVDNKVSNLCRGKLALQD